MAYSESEVVSSGPLYESAQIKDQEIIFFFLRGWLGIGNQAGGSLEGFSMTGEDEIFSWAETKIIAPDKVWSGVRGAKFC